MREELELDNPEVLVIPVPVPVTRRLWIAAPISIMAVVIGLLVAVSGGQVARADVVTTVVAADGFTASDLPNTVENTSWVSMDASPLRYGYFRFDVAVPAGQQVSSAVFRCYAGSSNSAGASLWTTSSSWSETALTWANAPVPNFTMPPAGSTGPVTSGTYASANVTSAVTTSGTYTFVGRTTSSTQWSCASKENTSNHPAQLVVTTVPTPVTTPPVTTTPPTTPPTSTTPPSTSTPPPAPTTTTLTTSADAFTASDAASVTHNSDWVSVDAKPARYGYFKFDVTVPAGQRVSSAVFQCFPGSTNNTGGSLWTAANTWSEALLTWNNAPLPNFALAAVGRTGRVSAGSYANVTVTSAVTGSGTYTFVLRTTSNTQWSCASKESTLARPAHLTLTTVPDSSTTPPPSTTPPVTTPPTTTTPPPPPTGTVVDAIGDGGPDTAHWNTPLANAVHADNPAIMLWAGDVRMTGTVAEWQLYDNNYGVMKPVTLPTPGNHDWGTHLTGYNWEFGTGAPYADIVTYCNSVTLANGWGLFSINSYAISACLPKLTAFLATPGTRKIVVTHVPRWSGGSHGSSTSQAPIWDAMKGHAFALVSGHDHDAQIIEQDGMVQVVNGCAGADYYSVSPISGEVYYSTSAADCSYERFVLGTTSVTLQAVDADGSIDFTKTYAVTQ